MGKRGQKLFVIFKIIFFTFGAIELLGNNTNKTTVLAFCIAIVVFNSYFRQFFLYEKYNHQRYVMISVIFETLVTYYIVIISDHPIVILLFCTIIFEVAIIHSLYFSTFITLFISVIMYIWYSTDVEINSIVRFIFNGMYTFGLAIFLVFVLGHLIKVQMRERWKVTKINQELEEAYQRLLTKSSQIQELSIEKERLRMAREIHDTLAHTLTAVVVQMEACKKLIRIDSNRAQEEIEKAQLLTREGLNDVKRTIKALRPQILENRSFFDAILNLIEDVERSTKVKIVLSKNVTDGFEMPSSMEVALFRVIQESITNSIRHGQAKEVNIEITQSHEGLIIGIIDNGRGCSSVIEGFGLKGIKERIKDLRGTVDYSSARGDGFQTMITVPCKGVVCIGN